MSDAPAGSTSAPAQADAPAQAAPAADPAAPQTSHANAGPDAQPQQPAGPSSQPYLDLSTVADPADPGAEPTTSADGQPASTESGSDPAADSAVDYSSVQLPEGALLPDEAMAAIQEFGQTYKLPAEAVQAMAESQEAYITHQQQQRVDQVNTWKAALAKHPELGGENLAKTNTNIEIALQSFPKMRALLDDPSESNPDGTSRKYDPVVAEFLNAVGASSTEPRSVVHGDVPATSDEDTAEAIWPNSPVTQGKAGSGPQGPFGAG